MPKPAAKRERRREGETIICRIDENASGVFVLCLRGAPAAPQNVISVSLVLSFVYLRRCGRVLTRIEPAAVDIHA